MEDEEGTRKNKRKRKEKEPTQTKCKQVWDERKEETDDTSDGEFTVRQMNCYVSSGAGEESTVHG